MDGSDSKKYDEEFSRINREEALQIEKITKFSLINNQDKRSFYKLLAEISFIAIAGIFTLITKNNWESTIDPNLIKLSKILFGISAILNITYTHSLLTKESQDVDDIRKFYTESYNQEKNDLIIDQSRQITFTQYEQASINRTKLLSNKENELSKRNNHWLNSNKLQHAIVILFIAGTISLLGSFATIQLL
ncbi:MAG: hypothetical protein WC897_03525 [Candidatus Gracilibacteria bacterium]